MGTKLKIASRALGAHVTSGMQAANLTKVSGFYAFLNVVKCK